MNMTLRPGRGDRLALGAPEPGQVPRVSAARIPRPDLQWTVGIPPGLHRTGLAQRSHDRRGDPGGGRADSRRRTARPASSSGRCAAPTSSSEDGSRSRGPARGSRSPGTAKSWQEVGGNLDKLFPPDGPARYGYYLRCELSGPGAAPAAANHQRPPDGPADPSRHGRRQEHVHLHRRVGGQSGRSGSPTEWVERSATPTARSAVRTDLPVPGGATRMGPSSSSSGGPPPIPTATRSPTTTSSSPARADMKWPLSMSFAKLISRTADAGRPRYTLPGPGLLNPDTRYFWHVRAQDDKGVWGPWSATWSFTPRGPAPPRDVTLEFDARRNRGVLRWAPNPQGPQARGLPSLCQRREGLLRQRPALQGHGGGLREDARPSSPRTSWSRPRPPSWRWSAPTWSSPARTRPSTGWSRLTRRASAAGLPTTPPPPGRSSSASP